MRRGICVRLWIGGVLAGAVIIFGSVLFWAHQGRLVMDRVREAEELLAAGRGQEALAVTEEALAARPELMLARRVRVDALAAIGSRGELDAARENWEMSGAGEDAVRLIQAAMRWNEEAIARGVLSSDQVTTSFAPVNRLALESTVNARWGAYEAAVDAFDQALALGYPENDQSRLTAGILRIQEGDIDGGLERLEAVSEDSPFYPEAAGTLVMVYRQSGRSMDVQRHAEAYFKAPRISLSEKLATLDFLHENASASRMALALDWIWHTAPTGGAIADLLIWCYLDDRMPEWADAALAGLPEAAFENEPVRLVTIARSRQIGDRGMSAGLEAGISASASPYAALLQLASLADDGLMVGSLRQRVLTRELRAALVDSPRLIDGVDRFSRAFFLGRAWEPVLVQLTREDAPVAEPAVRLLFKMYSESRDTAALWRLMERAVELNPDNIVSLNNYVHLGLLLKADPPRFYRLAERVGEQGHRRVHFAGTYAFSLLLQGRAADARTVLEQHPAEALREPAIAPYYAAALAATGDSLPAADILASIDPAELFAEERALLEQTARALDDEREQSQPENESTREKCPPVSARGQAFDGAVRISTAVGRKVLASFCQ